MTQALFNEEGMVEIDKGACSIEPFLYVDGRLITWADVALQQELEEHYLPIPSSEWRTKELVLRTTAFATGDSGASVLYLRYRLENRADGPRPVRLFAAIRPFQVTPTWQNWHEFGGVSQIEEMSYSADGVRVNRSKLVIPLTTPNQFGAAAFAQGAITEYLATGELPPQTTVSDDFGYASGALRFDLELAPHSAQEIYLAIPFGSADFGGGGEPSVASRVSGDRAVRYRRAAVENQAGNGRYSPATERTSGCRTLSKRRPHIS